ncbi:hypothetical protein DPMN_030022 [Dreissena polymorpha]|uniref:Uncharacterized protein n=1 Tax=Dreissena polymorpha TaxID=45954 RepID=A0A9D4LZQ2_DREPO|nr:hypothetical protein DPMN_030022 [Dreissena polymorpha]
MESAGDRFNKLSKHLFQAGRSSWNQQIIFHYLTRLHEFNQQTYDQFPVCVHQQTCMKVGFCHKAREQWMGLSYP